jgi:hypothetical protein
MTQSQYKTYKLKGTELKPGDIIHYAANTVPSYQSPQWVRWTHNPVVINIDIERGVIKTDANLYCTALLYMIERLEYSGIDPETGLEFCP